MLDGYLRQKTALYSADPGFSCIKGCRCPGCSGRLTVSASLLEIHAQARFAGIATYELFERGYRIAPAVDESLRRARVRFVLNKPCLFFDGEGCATYPVRPASCALFPEYLMLTEPAEIWPGDSERREFPCLERAIEISEERQLALVSVMDLLRKEVYAADFFLFGVIGFTVDLRETIARLKAGDGSVGSGSTRDAISFDIIEKAFDDVIKRNGIYDRIQERVERFDQNVSSYFSYLQVAETILTEGVKWNTPIV